MTYRCLIIVCFVIGIISQSVNAIDSPNDVVGAVFVASNSADPVVGNEVLMYNQADNGQLGLVGRFATGGLGSGPGQIFRGDPLGAQNPIVVSDNKRFLLVTNFLSNDVSVFRIESDGLTLTDVVPVGAFPVAIAENRGIVYVLSIESGEGSVRGFRLRGNGRLNALPNSVQTLDAEAPNPAIDPTFVVFSPSDILFSPDGSQLVVIIKGGPSFAPFNSGNGRILVFDVRRNGRLGGAPVTTSTVGDLPFAGVFHEDGRLVVVESFGGPPLGSVDGTAAISSFNLNEDGSLSVITESLPLDVLDTCWVVRADDVFFTANFFSDSISTVKIQADGTLDVLDSNAATTAPGSFNLDLLALGGFLYNVLPGEGAIAGFQIADDQGSLISIGQFTDGLEASPDVEPAELGSTEGGAPVGLAGVLFND